MFSLNLVIFFLWGHLKGQVFQSPPRDINDLRARIVAAVETLRGQRGVIRNAMRTMRTRAEVCVERNGGHVEGHCMGLDWERKTPKMCYNWEKKLLRKHWSFFFLGVKIVVGVKTGESCVNPILSGLIELLRAQSSVTESWISWCHKKEDIVSYQMLLAISKIFSQVQVISKLISVSFFQNTLYW